MIVELDLDGLNVRELCREHGISTWFFYDLRRRFAAEGEAALVPRSRAPRRVANRTRPEIEDAIVGLRKELDEAGLDSGPATIGYHLRAVLGDPDGTRVPSESTIWRVLVRRGFVVAQPEKAPKHAHRRFVAGRANECWQIDDTPWMLADGTPVKIINIIDDCSRVAVCSRAVFECSGAAALDAVFDGAHQWGLPERMLSDNAKAFRHTLSGALRELGVAAGHSRPYHPQTCGKVERFHQTVKKYLDAQDRPATLAELQDQLDSFRAIYNHQRPHRALGRQTPAHVWDHTPKSGPAAHPLGAPTTIHHSTVASDGRVSAAKFDNTRTIQINLGKTHAGQPATILTTGLACHVFIHGRLARKLTLDPSRRYQPLQPKSQV